MQPYPPAPNQAPFMRGGRFKKHLPFLSALVGNPLGIFVLFGCLAVGAAYFSIHYAVSLIILTLPFISYYLERPLLERILLPPFTILTIWVALGFGVGAAFVTYSREGAFDRYLLTAQVATLFTYVWGWFFYRLGFGKTPRMTFPEVRSVFDRDVMRPLVWIGWFFLVYQVVRTIILAKTGALDRGDFGNVAMGRSHFGIWTYFNLLPRLDNFGFFLFPVIWQRSYAFAKIPALLLLIIYFTVAFVTGGRSLVFFPLLYLGVGFYFFRFIRFMKLDLAAGISALVLLPLIVFIDAYRNTDAYRSTTTLDIVGRIQAIDDGFEKMLYRGEDTGRYRASYYTLGSALIGVSDTIIYEVTPTGIPHAGFENFDAILYTWIPFFIKRDKPLLLDGNPVMWRYKGERDRTGRALSTTADAYRRFGWIGVPFFAAFYFWLYGLFCGKCYKIYLHKNALWGILLILFTFSFFYNRPMSTFLTNWWTFFYEIPKHLIALYIGYWVLTKILNVRAKGGALQYGGRE